MKPKSKPLKIIRRTFQVEKLAITTALSLENALNMSENMLDTSEETNVSMHHGIVSWSRINGSRASKPWERLWIFSKYDEMRHEDFYHAQQ